MNLEFFMHKQTNRSDQLLTRLKELIQTRYNLKMDVKPTPFEVCDQLLRYVKLSNLNFSITESPFSATIIIKKSFIKDKNGDMILSNPCELLPRSTITTNLISHEQQTDTKYSIITKTSTKANTNPDCNSSKVNQY